MRGQILKSFTSLVITLLFVGSLLTTFFWYTVDHNNVDARKLPGQKKSTPQMLTSCKDCNNVDPKKSEVQKKNAPQPPSNCKECKEVINKVMERYSKTWQKKEHNYEKFRSQLNTNCQGADKAVLTQANTVMGTKLVYDGDKKRSFQVNKEIFNLFAKESPFPNKTWDTCAVVGNGGILVNSSCGRMIDSAQFVIRCNLPPLLNGYEKHVGVKTNVVTANPSIFTERFGSLMGRRRPFIESLRTYGNPLILIPAFSFAPNTPVSLRAAYAMEDFESAARPAFFNPNYLQSLAAFWRTQGLKEVRLSTGIIMASLALELCANVHLYGFWPFSAHPFDLHDLTNHYYDDRKVKAKLHAMPAEFDTLLRLHSDGVLKLHLGVCPPGEL